MSCTAHAPLKAFTGDQIRNLLSVALVSPCVLGPCVSASWIAELVEGYPEPRVIVRLVQHGGFRMDNGPLAAVDVTLCSDAYDLERKLANEGSEHYQDGQEVWLDAFGLPIADLSAYDAEIDGCAWSAHVDACLSEWVGALKEQLAGVQPCSEAE